MDGSITVDFRRSFPVFPLPGFVLLPHAAQPLHIFEPRYRQMVRHCLAQHRSRSIEAGEDPEETGGQFALGTLLPPATEDEPDTVALRPVVCLGHIVRHEPMPDGRCNILVQGVCRARIVELLAPAEGRLYHSARLAPIEVSPGAAPALAGTRAKLRRLVAGPHLSRLVAARDVLDWIDRPEIPTHALLEIVGYAIVRDAETRYRLLEEPSVRSRARIIGAELDHLASMIAATDRQSWRDWPKGVSWN